MKVLDENQGTSVSLLVILIILLVALAAAIITLVILYVKKRKARKLQPAVSSTQNLTNPKLSQEVIDEYQQVKSQYETKLNELSSQLAQSANLSSSDAKTLLIKTVDQQMSAYVNQSVKVANEKIKENVSTYAQQILVDTMESMAQNFISDSSIISIGLKDDSLKGRIIGKDGRNKKAFEQLTGVELIIEKTPEITLSSPNPVRRELAYMVMNQLILNKNIEPLRIQKVYDEESIKFETKLYNIGKQAIEDELLITDISHKLYSLVGRLYLRTSFGQNVLSHMLETAKIAQSIAIKLGLDGEIAKRVGFFHDIGKANDFEIDNDHVTQGIKIANEFGLDKYILDAIKSHHDGYSTEYIYSQIVKIADTLSAARPGARMDVHEDYIKRVNTMEDICLKHPGVSKAYALRAGRYLMVYVKPTVITEQGLEGLLYEIKTELETNNTTNKFQIEVLAYRTNTVSIKTEVPKK
jgi:ribonuclease Y